tara:strand:+ start:4245 stop:4574 length:330 start_codon:yes stop_codon:yes gene_type:complete
MTITESAQAKWLDLVEKLELPQDTHLRVAIKGGGCSGFSKELDYCSSESITDMDVIAEHGEVKSVIDAKSMLFLHDATIDYVDGLMGAGFTITIPSAKNTCGCGESFSA